MCGKSGGERIVQKPALRVCDRGRSMTSGKVPAKAFAVFAVALMMLSVLPMINVSAPEAEGYVGDTTTVTYHYDSTDSVSSVKATYYGKPIAEYNPEFWTTETAGNLTNNTSWKNGVKLENHEFTVTLDVNWDHGYDWSDWKVYLPWDATKISGSDYISISGNVMTLDRTVGFGHHGEVTIQFNTTIETNYVFGGWNSKADGTGIYLEPGDEIPSEIEHLYAMWILPDFYVHNIDVSESSVVLADLYSNYLIPYLPYGEDYSKVSSSDTNKYSSITIINSEVEPSSLDEGTYRSTGGGVIDLDNDPRLNGEVIIDNIKIKGNSGGVEGNPTSQTSKGLYANGFRLILGTGIECSNGPYVQVYGGSPETSPKITDVRIFSGTYSNIIGGSEDASGTINSTSLTIVGNTEVLEAVWGASIGEYSDVTTAKVLIAGGTVNHKGFQEDSQGNQTLVGGFSTVIGGSRSGSVGNTEVEITGTAVVFAVQGGGREPKTHTTSSNVTISGWATIEHMVCGSLTDGNASYETPPVTESYVEVRDSATVKDVYGGGWDLWSNPLYPSTGKTNVVISGGHITGSVYGGGFRGSIGTGDASGTTSSVRVTGGVIDGSVYGGGQGGPDPMSSGNTLNTTGRAYVDGNVDVSVVGGTVKQNVYGGGFGAQMISGDSNFYGVNYQDGGVTDTAKVTGSVNVTVGGEAVISGSVYGGGKGISNNEALNGNPVSNIAAVLGSVTVNITSGNISGSVFGGGEFGAVDHRVGDVSVPGDITMNIGKATIRGDVFAGGLGETGRLAAYTLNRTVTVDGATIHGSIYGGSRLGNDNCTGSTENDRLTYSSMTEIRVVSVDMSGSGNVYGGGYMGYSFMDTRVFIGVPALEASGLSNASGYVNIKSVYGGSSIAKPTGNSSGTKLLDGSSYIEIGSHRADGTSPYAGVWIAGDVFGAGDYCDITGSSEVVFERFSQNISMLSVQKAGIVSLVGSSLVLDGNIDGATTQGSAKFSLNRVGHLILADDPDTKEPSRVEANAAVSISGYSSQYSSGLPSDYSKYNSIRMNSGMLFSILGQDDTGADVSIIEGHTVLESDTNQYYGAFAIGTANYAGTPVVVDDNTGFYVQTADGAYIPTQMADYQYTVDGEKVVFRVWYISGSYKVEDTLVLKDTGAGTVVSGTSDVKMPKLLTSSDIVFAGYYVNSDTPSSFNLMDGLDGTRSGSDFTVLIGAGEGSDYTTFNQGSGFHLGYDDEPDVSVSGLRLKTQVSTNGDFLTTGYVGTITLHFAEVSGGIAVNVYDIEISVYLRAMDVEKLDIYRDVIMRGTGDLLGTTDVYLPTLNQNRAGEYYITSVTIGGDITITPTSTNLNKDGWLRTDTMGETYYQDSTEQVSLGVGGVYSPVLRMDYTLKETADGSLTGATIVVEMREEGTENFTHRFTIHLNPIKVTQITITVNDTYLNNSPTSDEPWAEYLEMMSFEIDYGLTLSGTYVAINTSLLDKTSDVGFITGFAVAMYSINGEVAAGSSDYMEMVAGDQIGYEIVSIPALLEMVSDEKPDTNYQGGVFDYSDHSPRWYQNAMCMAEINFDSKFTKDLGIYAGYSIVVSVQGVIDDEGGFRFVSVTPDVIFSGAPGKTVNLNEMAFTLPTGYEISKWYSQYDQDNGLSNELTDGELTTFSNTTIYLLMVKSDYKLTLVFHYGNSTVSPAYSAPTTYHYGESVEVNNIDLSNTSAKNAHIASATGSLEGGGRWTVSVDSDSLSFTGPAGNITVDVYLSDEYHITITMPAGDYDDNTHFTFGEPSHSGTSWSISISESTNSSSRQDSVQITVGSAGASFHLSTKDMTYHGQSVVFSLYKGGVVQTEYTNELTVQVGINDSESKYEIRISVIWEVKLGSGYTAEYTEVDTDGNEGRTVYLNNGGTVLTGYKVTLTLNEGYTFGPSFNTQGVSMISDDPRIYRVIGNNISVMFGDAVLREYNLEITLSFREPVPGSLPGGTFVLSDSTGTNTGACGEYASGSVTITYKLASGAYSWKADYDGYVESSGSISVNGDTKLAVELSPVIYVIEFYDADGTTMLETKDGYWDTMIGTGIGSMINDHAGAWGVYQSKWDAVLGGAESTTVFNYDDFGGNASERMTLYLRDIPPLSDIVPDLPEIVIVTEAGKINGIHNSDVLVGLLDFDMRFTTVVGGNTVSVTLYTDGRVLIQNCPLGTGQMTIDLSRGIYLVLISVPELGNMGASS